MLTRTEIFGISPKSPNFAIPIPIDARMAELVDALVSNTNDSNVVPVRSRLRVLFKKPQMTYKQSFEVFILADMSAFCPHFFVKLKIFVY